MAQSERRKGLRGEQKVARVYRNAGWEIRKLHGGGDFIAVSPDGRTHHVESKNQERLQLPMWQRQVNAEAMRGATPVVVFPLPDGDLYLCQKLEAAVRLAQ